MRGHTVVGVKTLELSFEHEVENARWAAMNMDMDCTGGGGPQSGESFFRRGLDVG
jgi:hypothetical protein